MIGSRVNLNYLSGLFREIQSPPALYRHPAAISGGMHKLAFPSSVSKEFGFDLFQWFRELRLQEIVANFAYSFLFPPSIKLFGAAVPKLDCAFNGAGHHAIVYKIKKTLL